MADGGAHSQSPRFFCSSRGTLHLLIARTRKAPHPHPNGTFLPALVLLTGPMARRATYSLPTEPQ
jgi:hypothetical protein